MRFTDAQSDAFEALALPMIKWLNDNTAPHTTVIVTPTSAEVLGGVMAVQTVEFVKD